MIASIRIQNLKCSGCARTIVQKLEGLGDVEKIEVDVLSDTVIFECEQPETAEKVSIALKSLGYPSVESQNSFGAKAKSYLSCALGKLSN